jgi:hypothetical protein
MVTKIMTDEFSATGVNYDEKGKPMLGSAQVRDPAFAARFVAEARTLRYPIPAQTTLMSIST